MYLPRQWPFGPRLESSNRNNHRFATGIDTGVPAFHQRVVPEPGAIYQAAEIFPTGGLPTLAHPHASVQAEAMFSSIPSGPGVGSRVHGETVPIEDIPVEQVQPWAPVDEIFSPTWAPDGHAIVFTGISQALTDRYVYDLIESKLRHLTYDAYAALQPAWSPGREWLRSLIHARVHAIAPAGP